MGTGAWLSLLVTLHVVIVILNNLHLIMHASNSPCIIGARAQYRGCCDGSGTVTGTSCGSRHNNLNSLNLLHHTSDLRFLRYSSGTGIDTGTSCGSRHIKLNSLNFRHHTINNIRLLWNSRSSSQYGTGTDTDTSDESGLTKLLKRLYRLGTGAAPAPAPTVDFLNLLRSFWQYTQCEVYEAGTGFTTGLINYELWHKLALDTDRQKIFAGIHLHNNILWTIAGSWYRYRYKRTKIDFLNLLRSSWQYTQCEVYDAGTGFTTDLINYELYFYINLALDTDRKKIFAGTHLHNNILWTIAGSWYRYWFQKDNTAGTNSFQEPGYRYMCSLNYLSSIIRYRNRYEHVNNYHNIYSASGAVPVAVPNHAPVPVPKHV
jgi:hypothetical protein